MTLMVGYFISFAFFLNVGMRKYLNSIESQLESDLVISLAGATVRYGDTFILLSNTHSASVST